MERSTKVEPCTQEVGSISIAGCWRARQYCTLQHSDCHWLVKKIFFFFFFFSHFSSPLLSPPPITLSEEWEGLSSLSNASIHLSIKFQVFGIFRELCPFSPLKYIHCSISTGI